jgi:hypothetical protein
VRVVAPGPDLAVVRQGEAVLVADDDVHHVHTFQGRNLEKREGADLTKPNSPLGANSCIKTGFCGRVILEQRVKFN